MHILWKANFNWPHSYTICERKFILWESLGGLILIHSLSFFFLSVQLFVVMNAAVFEFMNL
jgi:hypothetical protein